MRIDIVPVNEMNFPRFRKSKYSELVNKILKTDSTEAVAAVCEDIEETERVSNSVRYTLYRRKVKVKIKIDSLNYTVYVRRIK